jgi:predicted RNA-binding Zn-ribbon protein involved in translation (DUF1610 family)
MIAEEHRFPCDTCGSDMRFDPGDDRLICDHCGNIQPLARDEVARETALEELDFATAIARTLSASETETTRASRCPNCGARVEFDPNIHAMECPFCATPVVADTGAARQIKPRAVIPFYLEEEAAREAMNRWLGSLWFAPNGLQEYARKGRKMAGVYTPCWTFDAQTDTAYRGQRGINYQERQTVMRDGKRQSVTVTKTRWTRVSGRVSRFFDDVLVVASTALPETFRKQVVHWDLTRLEPYQPQYLAGFRAEAYTVELEDAFVTAREIMDRQILRDIRFDIGGDAQRVDAAETRVSDVTFKHVLLPLWLAAYKFRGQSYRFVVNGQTGEVAGERPWSRWKIALAVIAGAILAALLGYLYAMNG